MVKSLKDKSGNNGVHFGEVITRQKLQALKKRITNANLDWQSARGDAG